MAPTKKRKLEDGGAEVTKEEASDPPTQRKLSPKPSSSVAVAVAGPSSSSSLSVTYATLPSSLTCPKWTAALSPEFKKPYFQAIIKALESTTDTVFPSIGNIFNAFNKTPLDQVKVVIIGQDPYHDVNQAHGLCFSVCHGVKPPPSLVNIYAELESDIPGFKRPSHGNLTAWAEQGILLLNATLTVVAHKANSHQDIGWQTFTDAAIHALNSGGPDGIVFLLWGNFAQKKGKIIDTKKHHVIKGAHPSPLSVRQWKGCKHFSKTNEILVKNGKKPIDWRLPTQ